MDDLPPVLFRSALLAAGYRDSEIQRDRRSGALAVLRRGAYLPAEAARASPEVRHALLVAAEVRRVAAGSVVSHVSAAVLHGLPVWGVTLRRVHVTRARASGVRAGPRVYLHAAPLTDDEVVRVGSTAVTSVARTVTDLARTCSFESALVTADAALRAELVTAETLAAATRRAAGWPGVPGARRVVAFADGRADGVGESRSRFLIKHVGIPTPVPQWEVWSDGRWLGRVDFGWPDQRTVAEFDGRVKYGRSLKDGQDPGEVVFQEKLREDRLRAAGLHVVRWIWPELDDFAGPAGRLRQALGLGGRRVLTAQPAPHSSRGPRSST